MLSMYCMHSLSSDFKEACSKPKENEINRKFIVYVEYGIYFTCDYKIFYFFFTRAFHS